MRGDEKLLLSCMHVFGEHFVKNGYRNVTLTGDSLEVNLSVVCDGGAEDASFVRGILDTNIDAALARPSSPSRLGSTLPNGVRISGFADVNSDNYKGIGVLTFGSVTKMRDATIQGYSGSIVPDHSNWPQVMTDLIVLAPSVGVGGDSGGLIVTRSGVALGLIIGSTSKFTYGVNIARILRTLDITLL